MAITKLTRSPRSAQVLSTPPLSRITRPRKPSTPPTRGVLKHPLWKLPVYETLHALNRDFEQVLADLEKLRKLGMFLPECSTIYQVMIQDMRANANSGLLEVLTEREMKDWTRFGKLRRAWEKDLEDPNDILREAEQLKKQRLKEAEKKSKRQRRGCSHA